MTVPRVTVPPPGTQSASAAFRRSVVAGLAQRPRRLQSKHFYDERGSRLFDRICELPEYYLTRTETGILERHAEEIARRLGRRCLLVELGSGSSRKTRILLDHLTEPRGYVPVDISCEHLRQTAARLASDYPTLQVKPVCADFAAADEISLPPAESGERRTAFFPGSSIGNFHPPDAQKLLTAIARLVGSRGQLLIGIDLKKDPQRIESAYNDPAGVTAEFNRNLLRRINRELGGDFVPEEWHHHAFYEPVTGRIEMHLVSRRSQAVRVGEERFDFDEGESIRTECSYKYSVRQLERMAHGFVVENEWTDPARLFAVLLLRVDAVVPEEVDSV